MPAGNAVNGKITVVSSVAQSSSSSSTGSGAGTGSGSGSGSSGSTIPVTITLSGQHSRAGLDQAAVSVNFAQARIRNVLSVPVTALVATAGGGYAVQEAAAGVARRVGGGAHSDRHVRRWTRLRATTISGDPGHPLRASLATVAASQSGNHI